MSAATLNVSEPFAPLFVARLTPYRSLSRKGFRILMLGLGSVCFTIGIVFWSLGFWPVMGFMGLDVALVYFAFRSSYAQARGYEDVSVSRAAVHLRQVSHRGKVAEHDFPQFGTRLEVDRHEEIGITQMRIANRARVVTFGSMLNPMNRDSFANAFAKALAAAKK
jgi:uncharacterized membrane protein